MCSPSVTHEINHLVQSVDLYADDLLLSRKLIWSWMSKWQTVWCNKTKSKHWQTGGPNWPGQLHRVDQSEIFPAYIKNLKSKILRCTRCILTAEPLYTSDNDRTCHITFNIFTLANITFELIFQRFFSLPLNHIWALPLNVSSLWQCYIWHF